MVTSKGENDMDELRNLLAVYTDAEIERILDTSELYSWQKEVFRTDFRLLRRDLERAYNLIEIENCIKV